MKDEIKEILDINILDDRETYIDYIDENGKRKNYEYIEAEDLLDYITNLQEENNYVNKKNMELSTLNTSLRSDRDIYKQRIDKAIEYIKKNKYVDDYGKWTIDDDNDYLLNLLQEKSDE